jgi:hypothetical protein
VHCLGFTNDPFPGGARMGFGTTWNGTYAEGDRLVQAPAGSYTFTATFTAWRGDAAAAVTVTLPLNVLAHMGQG